MGAVGTAADLKTLGFRETFNTSANDGYTTKGTALTQTGVDTAIAKGDLKINGVESALNQLQALITIDESLETTILKNDWRELSNSIIAEILFARNLQLAQAKRIDRLAVVEGLYAADIFSARGSAEYIAEALGISRANLYVLLQEVRKASAKEDKINLK